MSSNLQVLVRRRFAAPPEQVYDAWLDGESVGRWLFATDGGEMVKVEVDPRVGGRFTIVERRGEELAEHFGEYLELERPRRIVFGFWTSFDEERSTVTVQIEEAPGGCEVVLTHEMDPQWAEYADQTRHGWTTILEGLARSLGSA